jgi:hypothetical protein
MSSATNGRLPVSIANRITPSEYRSERWSIGARVICSGDAYAHVPTSVVDSSGSWAGSRSFTMPKSVSLATRPRAFISTLTGLQIAVYEAAFVDRRERPTQVDEDLLDAAYRASSAPWL